MKWRARWYCICLAAFSTTVSADELADFRYQRSVTVEAPGWVGVRLDGEAQIRLETDLSVLNPRGEVVPFRRVDEAARRDARVLSARREGESWSLEFDLGAQPQPHRRLYFELEQLIHAPDCRLQGSDDRQAWQALGAGDLFRFGAAEGLQQQALDYQESRHRYLKLSWAGGQRPPKVKRVQVAAVALEGDQQSMAGQCQPFEDGTECELVLPRSKAWIERIDLTFAGTPPLGFRLWSGGGADWRPLHHGVRRAAGKTRIAVDRGSLANSRHLRLEIHGDGATLEEARAWLASSSVVFEATAEATSTEVEATGTYTLAYGRTVPSQPLKSVGMPDGPIAWIEAGEEKVGAWPAWPQRMVAPQVEMPTTTDFGQRWPVTVDAAKGELVRLELPAEATPDLAGVRLAAGQMQVPFLRLHRTEPRLIERLLVVPEAQGDGQSEALVSFNSVVHGSSLQLFALGPFERRVTGQWQEQTRPGVDGGFGARLPGLWSCNESSPAPCGLTGPGPIRQASELRLTFRDGDNPPLANVRVEQWAPLHELWFVWPGEPVVLYAGGELPAPHYDISRLESLLRLRQASEASLAEPEALTRQADLPSWALWLVLGLAAVVLVWQLKQVLRAES